MAESTWWRSTFGSKAKGHPSATLMLIKRSGAENEKRRVTKDICGTVDLSFRGKVEESRQGRAEGRD